MVLNKVKSDSWLLDFWRPLSMLLYILNYYEGDVIYSISKFYLTSDLFFRVTRWIGIPWITLEEDILSIAHIPCDSLSNQIDVNLNSNEQFLTQGDRKWVNPYRKKRKRQDLQYQVVPGMENPEKGATFVRRRIAKAWSVKCQNNTMCLKSVLESLLLTYMGHPWLFAIIWQYKKKWLRHKKSIGIQMCK